MDNYRLAVRLGIIGIFALSVLGVWTQPLFDELLRSDATAWAANEGVLSVTFLNVGQGDAILIETPDGVQVLIDGGPDSAVLRELTAALPWFDRTLDLVIGTHPDKDHIGGLIDVLQRYQIAALITTENTGETMIAATYHSALVAEEALVTFARAGQVYQLGSGVTLAIFSPASDPSLLESNTASIVVQLRYGDIEFMLTGDAPQGIEDYLVATYGAQLESEVLKLGHHGSKTSSGASFLASVAPQFAVVSAGLDNSYGHPNPDVVSRVTNLGIPLLNTATLGRVTFQTDGATVWVK